jgi:hypothetical protein
LANYFNTAIQLVMNGTLPQCYEVSVMREFWLQGQAPVFILQAERARWLSRASRLLEGKTISGAAHLIKYGIAQTFH